MVVHPRAVVVRAVGFRRGTRGNVVVVLVLLSEEAVYQHSCLPRSLGFLTCRQDIMPDKRIHKLIAERCELQFNRRPHPLLRWRSKSLPSPSLGR